MKTLLISTALLAAPLVGTALAQGKPAIHNNLVSEQERQIKELKKEVSSLRSLLNLERRKNGKPALSTSSDKSYSSHTVKAGDTFSSISRKYGISVSSLITSNPSVKPSRIAINQKLVIPRANTKIVASNKPVTTKSSTSKNTIATSNTSTYKVNKGDTFFHIAKRHKMSVAALKAANPNVNPGRLKIGQTLRLNKYSPKPVAKSQPKTTSSKRYNNKKTSSAYKPLPKVVSKPADVKKIYNNKPVSNPVSEPVESYIQQSGNIARTVPVKREMTYGAFARQHNTSITVLNTLNGLDLPADEPMAVGSELFIPNN